MEIKDQICTFNQAEELRKLGLFYEKANFWYDLEEPDELYFRDGKFGLAGGTPAYTVAELGILLPAGYDTMYITGEGWSGFDRDGEHVLKAYDTEAECRGAILIELIKRKEVDVETCNKTLIKS